ncbi:MAG TPA: hypothetical protein VFO36_07920, partial [Nitrospiraceae bacterium]|nr:hypothetical protein [Nitrospiraceae bacterium]
MIRTIVGMLALGFVCSLSTGAVVSAQSLAVPIPQGPDPLLTGLTIPPGSQAHAQGMWSPVYPWKLNPIHMVVMPDGKVVTFGSEVDVDQFSDGVTFDLWKPRRGFVDVAHRLLDNIVGANSFCAAS